MGQDREFTEQESMYALRTVQKFRDHWELTETQNLKHDIEHKLQIMETDRVYHEQHESMDNTELEAKTEQHAQAAHGQALASVKEGEHPPTDEDKALMVKKIRFQLLTK